MQTSNQANRAIRDERVGHVWVEKLTNAMGTLKLAPFTTIRVRAAGATTVTIGGTLAMTMMAGEIEYFCVPAATSGAQTVDVVIAGAAAYVQVAQSK